MRFSQFLRFYPSQLKKLKSVLEFAVNCPSLWRKQLSVHKFSSAFYRRNMKFEKCRIFRQIVEELKGRQFNVNLPPFHEWFKTKLKERKIPSNGNIIKVNQVVLTEKRVSFSQLFSQLVSQLFLFFRLGQKGHFERLKHDKVDDEWSVSNGLLWKVSHNRGTIVPIVKVRRAGASQESFDFHRF